MNNRNALYALRQKNRSLAGFTLVEIMVVVTIIGLLAAVVTPAVMNRLSSAKKKDAFVQIKAIEAACDMYKMDVGTYPNSLNDLVNDTGQGWDGPYLKNGKIPKDPWGGEFSYENRRKYVVITSDGDGDGTISNIDES